MRKTAADCLAGFEQDRNRLRALYALLGSAILGLGANPGMAAPFAYVAQASTAISNAGLVLGTVTRQEDGTVPPGDVISQNPEAGANVAGGTAVNLVVSSGSGGGGGGGGSMKQLTLLGLIALLSVGWRRTRSAMLLSEQELDSSRGSP
jgi:PASTA domain